MSRLNDLLLHGVLTEGKNTHLTHLEDSILINGKDGVDNVLGFIKAMFELMSINEEMVITRKWDGSPAIVGGINPENGQFFVGTKAVFSKGVPKLNYTNADVDKFHGSQGDLPKKLKFALQYLPSIWKGGIFQGDMMYVKGQLKAEKIDGETYITFRPNNITYSVPLLSDLGKQIQQSNFGIVFHTRYTGNTMADLKSSFNVNRSDFKKSKDVWFDDAHFKDISNVASFSDKETAVLKKQYNRLVKESLLAKKSLDVLMRLPKFFMTDLMRFNNSKIREGQEIGNVAAYYKDYVSWMISEKKSKLKSFTPLKEREMKTLFTNMKRDFLIVLDYYNQIIAIKGAFIKKLDSMKSIKTFMKTSTGFKVVGDEGFVAIQDDKAFKLVDKMEFTRNLFSTGGKDWST